jgi:purine-binding chemotaxis protein CheW
MNELVKVGSQPPQPLAREEEGQYLTFTLGGEMFAVSIVKIKEIIEYGQLTSVPMMPNFIRGVLNLRGQVAPVIDLQARLGRDSSAVGKRTCIVIVEVAGRQEGRGEVIGVVVDAVSEVLAIQRDQIERAPQFGANLRTDFIAAMAKIHERLVVILNLDKVLSIDELSSMVGWAESSARQG